jgi:preprotein translocase SecE subunit
VARTRTRTVEKEQNRRANTADHAAQELEREEQVVRKERPTPSARDAKPRGAGSTGLVNRIPVVRSVWAYFRGVASEMQKVTGPTREETTHLTSVVLAVTISFAIGLGMLDGFFSWWFQQAFHADSEGIFLAVAAIVTVLVSGSYFALRNRI